MLDTLTYYVNPPPIPTVTEVVSFVRWFSAKRPLVSIGDLIMMLDVPIDWLKFLLL